MKIITDLVRLLFRKKTNPTQVTEAQRRKLNHLPVLMPQQEFSFSCVPACLGALLDYIGGIKIAHAEAIRLTECDQDGAVLESIPHVLKERCKIRSQTLRSIASVKKTLRAGYPIVSNDSVTYESDHAILLLGATRKGVYIGDPATGAIHWRSDKWLKEAAQEFIAIMPPPEKLRSVVAISK